MKAQINGGMSMAASKQQAPVVAPVAQEHVQHSQYQSNYAPRPRKQATHPTLEVGLAIVSVLAAAWLWVDALTSSIALFGDRGPAFNSLTGFAVSHLSGFAGVTIVALLGVAFSVLALVLFQRTTNAIASGEHKIAIQAGIAIAVIKSIILGVTAVAVGLTPLLTLREGADIGPVYLYDFLPLVLGALLFGAVAWMLIKLAGKQQVGAWLAGILLIGTSLVCILGVIAVIVKSHDDNYRVTPTTYTESIRSWEESLNSSDTKSTDNSSKKDSDSKSSTKDDSDNKKSTSNSDLSCSEAVSEYIEGSITSQEYIAACSN